MLFPKNRMRLTHTYQGKSDPDGWVVLDLAGFDLEGLRALYLPVADLKKVREGGDQQAERLRQARMLLGGDEEEVEEPEE